MAKIIMVDETRCLGCKTCELECALAHSESDTLTEAVVAGCQLQSRVHVEPAGSLAMPMQCRHCEDAPCIKVCPTDAICRSSQEAPVLLDQDQCIGCKLCMFACPFGAIDMSKDDKAMVKCDMCIERTEAGELPACVAGCPTKAMRLVELDDHLRQQRRRVAQKLTSDL